MRFVCGPSPVKWLRSEAVLASLDQPKLLMAPIGFPLPPMSRAQLFDYALMTRQYWELSSYGAIIFGYDAAPNFVPDGPPPFTCGPDEYTAAARGAANALGYTYTHPVYMIFKLQCSWGGIGNVGYPPAWINADQPFGTAVTHEIGHNIGFGHAHGLVGGYNGTQELSTWPRLEYGDPYDVMGTGFQHCSALEKEKRSWLPPIRDLGRPALTSITLAPLEGIDGERAIKIDRQAPGSLCLEYRQPVGLDSGIGPECAVVHFDYSDQYTYVMTLQIGQTYTDHPGGVILRFNGGGSFDIATFPPNTPPPALPIPVPYVPIPFVVPPQPSPPPEDFVPDPATELYLGLGQRFKVGVTWKSPDSAGVGTAIPLTQETGAFWFFSAGNYELVIKVLDGTAINGNWWVFYGSLTNVQFTLTVTDTSDGAVKVYDNPQGTFASVGDTNAFPAKPPTPEPIP